MKHRFAIALVALMMTMTGGAQTALKKEVYNENINTLEQIDEAVSQAKAAGKYVVCQVGGNWCPWCLRFADFITSDEDIAKLINDNFIYIHVNYNPHRAASAEKTKQAKQTMSRLGNPARFGFPVMVVLDADGKVIHTQDSSFLEEGQGYDKEKVMRFFSNWTPKAVQQ
jgi:uncharacterized protein YyaL (SSP411 family)